MVVTVGGIHIKGRGKKREGVKGFEEDYGRGGPLELALFFIFFLFFFFISLLELSTVNQIVIY